MRRTRSSGRDAFAQAVSQTNSLLRLRGEGTAGPLDASHPVAGESPFLKAWINQYLTKEGTDHFPSVMLDIDVFLSESYPPIWNDIAEPLEKIHDLKNRLFFGSLTDPALDAYK